MDNPGHSIFGGISLHLEGITTPDLDDEREQEEYQREEEEENKRREEEIKNILANAFDDLEEEESYVNHSSHYSVSSNYPQRNPIHENADSSESHQEVHHAHDIDTGRQTDFRDLKSSVNEYGHINHYDHEDQQNHSLEDHDSNQPLSRSSSQRSISPWTNDSQGDHSSRFSPFVAHETDGNFNNLSDYQDPQQSNFEMNRKTMYDNEGSSYVASEAYHADHYKSNITDNGGDKEVLRNQYNEADTAYDQLKLLYEARGRELDKQMSELSKMKFESSRDIRVLQHQLNLLKSDNESKNASVSQLQILLTDKDERLKSLVSDLNEINDKLKAVQDENKKIHFQLETAESTISSLECQISELKAADSLSRNQQLHEDFVRKLQQGSKEEKNLLLTKCQEAQREVEAGQQEIKRLRDELKNLRATYDDALIQKSETVTKLTLTVETLRKQYEDLLHAHDVQQILELQLKIKTLESNKQNLENKVCTLEQDLAKHKEELDGFDTVMKLGIWNQMVTEEDSLEQLGIKKTLNYDDTHMGDKKKDSHKFTETEEKLMIRDELKRSLLINKAKRDEISMLKEESQEKQALLKKAQSDLKDALLKIKELQRSLMILKLEHSECQLQGDNDTIDNQASVTAIQAENVSLRKELALLQSPIGELKHSFKELSDLIQHCKNSVPNSNSEDDSVSIINRYEKLLQHADSYRNFIADTENFQKELSEVREENRKLHESRVLWEKRMNDIQIRLKVSEKMIVNAVIDEGKSNDYNHACNTIQKLLEDIQALIKVVKKENSDVYHENVNLRDQLSSHHLELDRLKKKLQDIREEKKMLEEEMMTLSKKKDEERALAVESCQNTYLKFHEEAVRELEIKIKTDYENIARSLKEEITRLSDELNNTKELYIKVCQEKDEIEHTYRTATEEKTELERQKSRDISGETITLTPDSGVGDNENMYKEQPIVLYKKKINDLEIKLANLKEKYNEENKEIVTEKQNLKLKYRKQVEEINTVRQESSRSVEELQNRCSALEKVNSNLKDQCQRLEDEILKMKESKKSENEELRQPESWRIFLERQQKRLDEEKEEMKRQYENLIEELQNKYTKAESSKLLENKVREQEEDMKLLENKVREQEKDIKTITDELERMKDKFNYRGQEHEQETQRLTDIIQNLESEVKEKEEENNNTRAAFQKFIQELKEQEESLKQKLQRVEEEVIRLRETEGKYNSLKLKVNKYRASSKELSAYYEERLETLATEYSAAKETLLERVRAYLEEVKQKCILCIDSIISTLKELDNMQISLDATLIELEELSKELRNFCLHLK